jgi:hypothetical protein
MGWGDVPAAIEAPPGTEIFTWRPVANFPVPG